MSHISAPKGPPITRITVMQGQARVSAGPRVELSTVLGSCVATCLYDPEVEVGGMNHFLLAEPPAGMATGDFDEHYGVYLMELLINEMLAHGAAKPRLRAHLYGGANLNSGLARIGTRNAEFARQFLSDERITVVREDLGGSHARRVDFRPARGQVRCRAVETTMVPETRPTPRPMVSRGDVELF
ncbi:MAG: chemotaxis protein CheD [Sphingomonadales bacterium]|nr:chemotaxis protein CheD [Sphingomonadales bacterium]MDE2168900.1 chemotaxis protein CheD [Sphingomonadales bacterium]